MKKKILVTDSVMDRIILLADKVADQVMKNRYHGWDSICQQVEVVIPYIGLVGIEVVGSEHPGPDFVVAFYRKKDDEWNMCWRFRVPPEGKDRLKGDIVEQIYLYYYRILKDQKNRERRMYLKGDPIRSIDELLSQEFVFFHDKVTHRGWFMSWQLRMAVDMIQRGVLCYAIRKEDDNA